MISGFIIIFILINKFIIQICIKNINNNCYQWKSFRVTLKFSKYFFSYIYVFSCFVQVDSFCLLRQATSPSFPHSFYSLFNVLFILLFFNFLFIRQRIKAAKSNRFNRISNCINLLEFCHVLHFSGIVISFLAGLPDFLCFELKFQLVLFHLPYSKSSQGFRFVS